MLLSEEFALVAINPDTGRHGIGDRSSLNACLAALLVAELLLTGVAGPLLCTVTETSHVNGVLVFTASGHSISTDVTLTSV